MGSLESGEQLGMENVSCSDVRIKLPAVLREVEQQGGVTITRRGVPVARIVPLDGLIRRGPEISDETRMAAARIRAARVGRPRLSIEEILCRARRRASLGIPSRLLQ